MVYDSESCEKINIISNALIFKEVCLPVISFPLIRYETIAEFYTEQPIQILIHLRQGEELDVFERVAMLRKWVPNDKLESWSIYSNTRDLSDKENQGIVMRKCVWDRKADMQKVLTSNQERKKELAIEWPTITSNVKYHYRDQVKELLDCVMEIDDLLSHGLVLNSRTSSMNTPNWSNLEFARLYNWGKIHSVWSPEMENEELEKLSNKFCSLFEECIGLGVENVYEMDLDYSYPLEKYKDMVCGI